MAIYRSTNPGLSRVQRLSANEGVEITDAATYGGVALKTAYFIGLTFISALVAFFLTLPLLVDGREGLVIGLLIGSSVLALICGFAAMFPGATKIAGTIYAVAEGFMMGFISLMFYAAGYAGPVFAALFSTIGIFLVMTFLYAKGIIRVGSGFKKFMISALIGFTVANLLMFLFSLFSADLRNIFYGNGLFSVAFSAVGVLLATFMILFDLNRVTEIVESGLHKKYEWTAAFGLLLTLVWLYIELLKLFVKIASRSRS